MDEKNPYSPPRAEVADVGGAYDGEFQKMTIWGWRGRLGRLRFLAYTTVGYLVFVLAMAVIGVVSGVAAAGAGDAALGVITMGVWVLLVPYLVFLTLVTIRRSHDMGWSGWMSLLTLIPFAGFIWLFKSGSPGANEYGPPPPPNGAGVKFAAFALFGLVFLGGILAAIAIPAYSDYVKRAQAAQVGK